MNRYKPLKNTYLIWLLYGLFTLAFVAGCSASGTPTPAVTLDTQNAYPALVLDNQGPVGCLVAGWRPAGFRLR